MIINFDNMLEEAKPNFRDGKGVYYVKMHSDGINKIFKGRLEPGSSIGMHTHYNDSEIMYFLEGEGTVVFDGEEIPVGPGLVHYCPKGHDHSLVNTGDRSLIFFATVVTQ